MLTSLVLRFEIVKIFYTVIWIVCSQNSRIKLRVIDRPQEKNLTQVARQVLHSTVYIFPKRNLIAKTR